jgi:transcriptional regulator with XRE-family HTH domain
MRGEQRLARLLRALSGKTQEEVAEEIGVYRSHIAQIELGEVVPGPEHLAAMAESAGISVADGEELLGLYETRRRPRRRWGRGRDAEELLDRMAEGLRSDAGTVYERLLTLQLPGSLPKPEDREGAEELFARLEGLGEDMRLVVVRVSEQFQTWALCERVCEASVREASRGIEAAAAWAHLAEEIAKRVRGPEGWRKRMQGYAAAFAANVLRVKGELKPAETHFEQAKRLWQSGSDAAGVLDPGRLLDLEALSTRRLISPSVLR